MSTPCIPNTISKPCHLLLSPGPPPLHLPPRRRRQRAAADGAVLYSILLPSTATIVRAVTGKFEKKVTRKFVWKMGAIFFAVCKLNGFCDVHFRCGFQVVWRLSYRGKEEKKLSDMGNFFVNCITYVR